ncbi:MAG: hypothetical protein AAF423_04385 [Pseudomonadota bacterium]
MKTKIAAIAFFTSIAYQAPAHGNELNGMELIEKIAGKRVFLATKWGIEFPLTYATSGEVTGDGTGTALGRYFAPKETGAWWVQGNQMCQKFPTWYDGRTFCFKLEETGADTFIWKRNDGKSGNARIG